MKIMTIRLPDEIQDDLASKAEQMGVTRNALVSFIINNWLYGDIRTSSKEKQIQNYDRL